MTGLVPAHKTIIMATTITENSKDTVISLIRDKFETLDLNDDQGNNELISLARELGLNDCANELESDILDEKLAKELKNIK